MRSLMSTLRREARVLPRGLKISFRFQSMFSIRTRKTSSGRGPVSCAMMFLSFFVVLGLFLLLAVKKPSAHRSLIAFAAWWSLFHSTVMAVQTIEAWNRGIHRDYTDVAIAGIFGALLLAVTPTERDAAAHRESASTVAP